MNVSELARILRVTPQELLDTLPEIGFDIGQKAIKIDTKTSEKIIKEWSRLTRQMQLDKEALAAKTKEEAPIVINRKISIPRLISVKDFATAMGLPVSKILPELMKNGIFASINERIDFDTASIIASDLGVDASLTDGSDSHTAQEDMVQKLKDYKTKNKDKAQQTRPPIVVVMGHVDHGKTSLLDTIRKTNVTGGEAGGITQHIGAYQVERKHKLITFIDTPGHEAFSAMRSRGARVADIALLIVAADDGVKPQTIESYKIIKQAELPFIVVINKIDKPGADIDRVKQELTSILNIALEDWGGKTVCSLVSAKKNQGVDELLDMILLTAEMEADNISSNNGDQAIGTIIESKLDKGEGPVATILIQNGILKVGDQLCFNGDIYGKVRSLKNFKGENIPFAGASTPAKIIGLKISPKVGDIIEVGHGEKIDYKKIRANSSEQNQNFKREEADDTNMIKLNVFLKSDALGSGEAIEESLEKLNTDKAKIKMIGKSLGNINEGDVIKAESAKAIVLGFNIKTTAKIESLAREKNVKIKIFNIIYDLIEYTNQELQELIKPEFERVDLGKLKVLAIFRTENNAQVVGGKVLEGIVEQDVMIEVLRNKELITTGNLVNLQSGKQNVKVVNVDEECGLRYEGKPMIEVGDILNFHKKQKING